MDVDARIAIRAILSDSEDADGSLLEFIQARLENDPQGHFLRSLSDVVASTWTKHNLSVMRQIQAILDSTPTWAPSGHLITGITYSNLASPFPTMSPNVACGELGLGRIHQYAMAALEAIKSIPMNPVRKCMDCQRHAAEKFAGPQTGGE